ncbi:hypothetical protein ACJMK2_015049, partial [Sinanodonta woodiana]
TGQSDQSLALVVPHVVVPVSLGSYADQSLALVVPHVVVPVSQGFYADQSLALVVPHVVVPVSHGLYADQFSGLGCPVRLGFYSRTGQTLATVVPVSLGFIPELDNH